MIRRFLFVAVSFLAPVYLPSLAAQSYSFQVEECGADTAYPTGMNNQGTIVGAASTIASSYSLAFVYSGGVCKTVFLGTEGTSFLGITDANQILGLFGSHLNYLLQAGPFTFLPNYPGAALTYYCCLGPSGLFAGNYRPTNTTPNGTGFFYQNGKWATLPSSPTEQRTIYGLNSHGIAVGTYYGLFLAGFVYNEGKLTYLQYPDARFTTFNGINDNGIVVGTYLIKVTNAAGIFTYDLNTGIWTDLKFPFEYAGVIPVGINNAGVIAAQYTPSGGLLIATPQ